MLSPSEDKKAAKAEDELCSEYTSRGERGSELGAGAGRLE
jgi:hypothetical protein